MKGLIKILQFGRHFPPHTGGTETVMYDLTEGLNKLGASCDVLCCNDENVYAEESLDRAKIYRTKTWFKTASTAISPQQILTLKAIWRKYDIIHVHHPSPMAALCLFLVKPGARIVLSWHSDIIKQKTLLKFYKPIQDWLIRRADSIVATTPEYIKYSESLKKFPDKTTYIPLGISRPSAADAERLKKKYNGKKIIFSLGRLVEYKGYQHLVDAAKYLDDTYVVLIGGKGHLHDQLQEQIRREGLGDKVKLLGRIDDNELATFYAACDLFCLPSITKNEAFGLVLAEAMSYSKPVVATEIPGSGVPWVNQHNVTGLNVPVADASALATAIRQICENEILKNKFGSAAHKRYLDVFDKKNMVQAYFDLYHKIL